MSQKYHIVLFKGEKLDFDLIGEISELAQMHYGCDGVEEYSLQESDVDKILKEKAFSGSDVKLEIIDEMEKGVLSDQVFSIKFYFSSGNYEERAMLFTNEMQKRYPDYVTENKSFDYEDWNQAFRDHFKKIKIADKLNIIPSWEKTEENKNDPDKIFIYPGQGFGTGNHETTYLCLKLYSELLEEFDNRTDLSCLDFGCGSGILGIAAIKLSHFQVEFMDIDKTALENTLQNITINFEEDLIGCKLTSRERFKAAPVNELVFANILEHILIEEKEIVSQTLKADGYLVISGLLNHQEKTIIEEYSHLEMKKIERKNDWSAILFQNTK